MKTLEELPEILDKMLSKQKEKKARTFVAKYKGKNLIMGSGKSCWKAANHAKSAIINCFSSLESRYIYPDGIYSQPCPSLTERRKKKEEFRAMLFELIEIVELEN